MKATKILIFIFSVIALLAMLCSFFPREGVNLGPLSLEFPSVDDVLSGAETDTGESPEELLERRLAAIEEAERSSFLDYFATDPARFYFPDDDIEVFDKLFEAFDRAAFEMVRVVHYGDSQIEEDRVSNTIRAFLQEKWGGGGAGLIPLREKYYSLSVSETATVEPTRYLVFGPAESRAGHRRYGPAGQIYHIDTVVTMSVFPLKSNQYPSRYFNRVTVIADGSRPLYAAVKSDRRSVASEGRALHHISFAVPDSSTRVSVTLSGNTDIYGILLDSDTGISLDNVAMKGCSGTVFTNIDSAQLKDYYDNENVRLIILQYGGNTVPYLKDEKGISNYRKSIEKQINYLRGLAPEATFVFIGPSDMSTNIQGKMKTYPHLPMIVDSLRAAATSAGAVFWDMYGAMGGEGSMDKWVHSTPALAGRDYVHFTPLGAEKMGEIFCKSFSLYYDYYKWRKDNED